MNESQPNLDRYARQIRYQPIGEAGQRELARGRVLVCGCGALGSVLANTLVRAGVGMVRVVDRDFLEINNLQRQVLYDEQDVASGLPKAIAAQAKLQQINSAVTIEAVVADVTADNIAQLADDVDVIVDGTDNFETRFLINDYSLQSGTPWVYGGCIGAEGQTMTILPAESACLHCLMEQGPPPPGTTPTCDSAGILGPIINVIASIQASEAIKILSGNRQAVSRTLQVIELWDNRLRQINLDSLRAAANCPVCDQQQYRWLTGDRGSHTAVLCGRNAVQLSFPDQGELKLDSLAEKLEGIGTVSHNPYLLRLDLDDHRITVFPDGRAIVQGTEDETEARTLYARFIGS